MRRPAPQDGDVVVVRMPHCHPDDARAMRETVARSVQQHLARHGRDVMLLVLHGGQDVERLDPEMMRRLGWVRSECLDRIVEENAVLHELAEEMRQDAIKETSRRLAEAARNRTGGRPPV